MVTTTNMGSKALFLIKSFHPASGRPGIFTLGSMSFRVHKCVQEVCEGSEICGKKFVSVYLEELYSGERSDSFHQSQGSFML